jgi:hypothetical protein
VLALTLSSLAYTAANVIQSGGRAGLLPRGVSPNDLAPAACSGLSLTSMRAMNGGFVLFGTASQLVLMHGGATIVFAGANSCIVAGADGVRDAVWFGATGDVCIQGPEDGLNC